MAVEIEPQSAPIRFTRRVPIATPFDLPETAECNLEPPSMRSKSRPHLGNAGLGLDHMPAGDKLALAMIPEIDIWRAASLMLKRYGEKALEESAARADELFAEQDHDGAAVWRRIIDAVGQLAKMKPSGRPHRLPGISFRGRIDPSGRPCRLLLKTDLFDSAAATARGSLSLGVRPMKRRRWRSPPR